METAKVFTNGGSQTVRLPKDCRFAGDEVLVNRIGSVVILMPRDDPWQGMLQSLDLFTDDFLADGVDDLPVQERPMLRSICWTPTAVPAPTRQTALFSAEDAK